MGWSSFNRPSWKTVKETIVGELTWSDANVRAEVLDIHIGRNVAYAAVKKTPLTDEGRAAISERERTYVIAEDGSYVFAVVALFTNKNTDGYNFGIKTMTECCGPNDRKCPIRILNLLSAFQSDEGAGYALKWRAECRENRIIDPVKAAKRAALVAGSIIRFTDPMTFGRGYGTSCTFEVQKVGRAYRFIALDHDGKAIFRCRIPKFTDRPHVVMTREEAFPWIRKAA
jgi:hypothetical protein